MSQILDGVITGKRGTASLKEVVGFLKDN